MLYTFTKSQNKNMSEKLNAKGLLSLFVIIQSIILDDQNDEIIQKSPRCLENIFRDNTVSIS